MKSSGIMERADLPAVLSALGESCSVFAPVEGDGGLRLSRLPVDGPACLPALGSRKPLLPLVRLFLPAVEDMFSFSAGREGTVLTPSPDLTRDRVVVGALACDIAALETIDRIFIDEHPDEYYRERRERTTLVAYACTGEGPECFCSSFGIDPLRPSGTDVLMTDLGDTFLVESITGKGSRFLDSIARFLRAPVDGDHSSAGLTTHSRNNVPAGRVPQALDDLWESGVWRDIALRCIGCGTCTVLCPTCHCFDVQDEKFSSGQQSPVQQDPGRYGTSGKRFRVWDSCMFPCFTGMAGGDNPRPTKVERVRQRFLHKLAYIPANHGIVACVGCGRCGMHCPAGIGIEEVITKLAVEEAVDG